MCQLRDKKHLGIWECGNGFFLNIFCLKIYQNNIFFYYLKIIFNISILK